MHSNTSQSSAATVQQRRAFAWQQPSDADSPLVLEGFDATERMSGLFTAHVRLSARRDHQEKVSPEAIVGTLGNIRVDLPAASNGKRTERYFGGMVSRFGETGEDDRRIYYSAELAPWLWLLSQTSDSRIFQDTSALDVMRTLLSELKTNFSSMVKFSDQTTKEYAPRDCVVQYNETDLNLFDRLAQEEGIYYYFTHDESTHTLVLRDEPLIHDWCSDQRAARHLPDSGRRELEDSLLTWEDGLSVTPGAYAVGDYHFQRPESTFESARPTMFATAGNENLEVYEYGARFTRQGFEGSRFDGVSVRDEAERFATMRIEAAEAERSMVAASSTCRAFSAGLQFDRILSDGRKDPNGPFLLTEVRHTARQPSNFRSGGGNGGTAYQNRLTCIPASHPFRPRRSTSRPIIPGAQTAIVEGPDGDDGGDEEIHVDEHGRVKVRFHWDRRGRKDDGRTSAWIRVGQGWASNGFGMYFWPRVGDEVIVTFLCGDPDRPLVVGSVYNAKNRPPYELPADKTKSGIKTRSTKGGDTSNFNEIRFEDRKGKEQVYVHAERNLSTVVEAAESRSVGGSRTSTIHNDDKLTVKKGNRTADVNEGNDLLSVLKGHHVTTVDEGDDFLRVAQGIRRVETKDYELTATSSISLNVGVSNIRMEQDKIILAVAGSSIKLDAASIEAYAGLIKSVAFGPHDVRGLPVKINC